jgi:anti-sigma-K factor RskA
VITHDQAHDLLPAFALDAVDDVEHDKIESHVNGCPRCATELMALRDVASALGNCVDPVPEGLWSVISSRLKMPEHEESPPPLLKILQRPETTEKSARSSARPPRSRTGRRYLMVVTAVAAAAVAATAVLGLSLARTSDQNDQLQAQLGTNNSSVVAALETPGHTLVSLRNANHAKLAQFVLLPSGRGYLVSSSLPKLAADRTYQLWGVVGGQPISLGLLGPSPSQAAFTVAGSGVPSQLGVTVEPASGSVVPSTAMLASGTTQT